jgi:hypothetical protein
MSVEDLLGWTQSLQINSIPSLNLMMPWVEYAVTDLLLECNLELLVTERLSHETGWVLKVQVSNSLQRLIKHNHGFWFLIVNSKTFFGSYLARKLGRHWRVLLRWNERVPVLRLCLGELGLWSLRNNCVAQDWESAVSSIDVQRLERGAPIGWISCLFEGGGFFLQVTDVPICSRYSIPSDWGMPIELALALSCPWFDVELVLEHVHWVLVLVLIEKHVLMVILLDVENPMACILKHEFRLWFTFGVSRSVYASNCRFV